MRKYFGTDGIRGPANTAPMTADFVMRLAAATGRYFRRTNNQHRVVIGKDTRLSGYMLENALTAGFTSTGMNVFLLGPAPTPAISLLTHSMRADLGVMISASHNPASDNGIKFFGPDGFKLSDAAEMEIEALIEAGVEPAAPKNIGRAKRLEDAVGRYVEYAKTTFPQRRRLEGLRIVLDCANGAAYRAAPTVLWELGAEVITLGTDPNGFNINEECGSTHPEATVRRVRETRADLGICLDGDADRVILVDETGTVIDGDQMMGMIASRWARNGQLTGGSVVATVMSNLGLEQYLAAQGVGLERTKVGDRYVVERMREKQINLGGEQSGHLVMTDYASTGDGLIGALQFLAEMVESGEKASALGHVFTPVPQKLVNVNFAPGTDPLQDGDVLEAIAKGEKALAGQGRLVIRPSGTEPLIRVMGEATDMAVLDGVLNDIVARIKAVKG
ncbi:phosphoglucosamine mutase [Marinovum sp. 2_MG-2023]|uniref:phosphoglucosamine mutase n=1 Tax=unclassified Marinovum TaxID=2647166 RepID=UPI0026E259D9|nr:MULTISPECIES: phosphoglucosamine mutase [unclassified Marinovum]MDO6732724.1 phosphoglucosamine mutase [Marinovum sp. 2_MG-2023]MDO6781998.1 phosphoglucosamine mutase [Marinovum sp. 1_MG-2023]